MKRWLKGLLLFVLALGLLIPAQKAAAEEAKNGWVSEGGTWHYYRSGEAVTGWLSDAGEWYYLDGTGAITTGWKGIDGEWYYFRESGKAQKGWMQEDGFWYYFRDSGKMQRGWLSVDGEWYYFRESGKMETGWVSLDGTWYYFRESGKMLTGWTSIQEEWYHFDSAGRMTTGWLSEDGEWYYFRESGKAVRASWMELDGEWYYFRESGKMHRGFLQLDETWYYFRESGKLAKEGWVLDQGDYYYINDSGVMQTGWLSKGEKYYLGPNGKMYTGWRKIDGEVYYFFEMSSKWPGALATNATIGVTPVGKKGTITDSGMRAMYLKAMDLKSKTNYLLLVNNVSHRVGIFTGSQGNWGMTKYFLCTVGAKSTPTVKGTFEIGSKGYYFDHEEFRCFWYTQFYRDYLFHSVLYDKKDGRLRDGRLGRNLSLGCVRLQIDNAKWIYDNVPRTSKVISY